MFYYFAACTQSAYNSFSNLGLLDKTLFLIVLISLIAKLALDIVCRHIQKKYNIDPEYKKPCVFLHKGKSHDCSIYKYKKNILFLMVVTKSVVQDIVQKTLQSKKLSKSLNGHLYFIL